MKWVKGLKRGAETTHRGTETSKRRATSSKRRAETYHPAPFANLSKRDQTIWLAVDFSAILVFVALIGVGFLPTFGVAWLWVTVMGGASAGLGLGYLSHHFRLRVGSTALLFMALWFLLGGFLAMPSSTIGFVVPTLRTLKGLATGPVTAWKAMLTIDPPIGETYNLLTAPLLVAMLASLLAAMISLRSTMPALAWTPLITGLVVAWALGTNFTYNPLLVALGIGIAVLVWTSYRRSKIKTSLIRTRQGFKWANLVAGGLVLVVAGGLTSLSSNWVSPKKARAIARSVVINPLDLNKYGSPLQGFRANISDHEKDVLFTATDLPEDTVIRLATMDSYDGITFNVTNDESNFPQAGEFRRVGAKIDPGITGNSVRATIQIGKLNTVWVPTIGQTTKIKFNSDRKVLLSDTFYYNRVSGTGLTTAGLQEGDTYTLDAVVAERPSNDEIKKAQAAQGYMPPSEPVPQIVKTLTRKWTMTARTSGEAALIVESQLHDNGYFSHGTEGEVSSLSGHSESRVASLLADPSRMIGDEEQYAVAMALMARELGIPSRVVYGYRAGDGGDITGADVSAWPELKFEDLGWVMFYPTPDHDRVLEEEPPVNPPPMRPYVDPPPVKPERPDNPPPQAEQPIEPSEYREPEPPIDWRQVMTYTALVGIPLIGLVGPVVLILGLKSRRRRQRKNNPDFANRVAGAWSELVDKSRDLGQSPSPSGTRSEQAEIMVVAFPKMIEESDPIELAHQADSTVFSPDPVSADQADAYWNSVAEATNGMRRSVNRMTWVRSALSTKSFRQVK